MKKLAKKVWLVGAGYMAREYYKALKDLGVELTVIGHGEKTARDFKQSGDMSRPFKR